MGDLHLGCKVKNKGTNLSNRIDPRKAMKKGTVKFPCPFCGIKLAIRTGPVVIKTPADLDPNNDLIEGRETHFLWKD